MIRWSCLALYYSVFFVLATIPFCLYAHTTEIHSQDTLRNGNISGTIVDKVHQQPLQGVSVQLLPLTKGTYSSAKGEFRFSRIPVGTYTLVVSMIGYKCHHIPDIIIRSGRTTDLRIELEETPLTADEVIITSSYFSEEDISSVTMSFEELRRAPGAAGDINRALVMLPSAVQLDDNGNDLIVRGGAPFENGYYIDNIFTPNINHFPQMGASGGNISILNMDFVRNVSLISGGFSPQFGNRLSSIVDITLREGNREHYDTQLDLNFTGFGAQIEGPLHKNASFMVSAKRSYLDIISSLLEFNGAPRFGDAQAKISWDIHPNHHISLVNIFGVSEFIRSRQEALDSDNGTYGNELFHMNTLGTNIRSVWNSSLYSNTSFSYAYIDASRQWLETQTDNIAQQFSYQEYFYTARHITVWNPEKELSVETGTELQWYSLSGSSPEMNSTNMSGQFSQSNSGIFINILWRPLSSIMLRSGMRAAYFSHNDRIYPEPRISFHYTPNTLHSLYISYGQIHQSLPSFLLAQARENISLASPQAEHYIVGWQWLVADDIQSTLELYAKEYQDFPLSPNTPMRFPTDDVAGDDDDFDYYGALISEGIAYTRGIELTVQKKLSDHIYGTIGATYFRSAYRDANKQWRNRLFDNRLVCTMTLGWKPTDEWEMSIRWIYAGGRAVTPILTEESKNAGFTIFDNSRYLEDHLPAYHSLNIRVDKRWNFFNTNLITYISIMNVYNRKNPSGHYWNTSLQRIDYEAQFPLIPLIGIEYEL